MGGVFLGVKNNSKNFENKKNYRLLSKILSKWTLFIRKRQKIMGFKDIMARLRIKKNFFNVIKVYVFAYAHMNIEYYDFLTF